MLGYIINQQLIKIFNNEGADKKENLINVLNQLNDLEKYIKNQNGFNAGEFFIFNSDKKTCQSIFHFYNDIITSLKNSDTKKIDFYRKNVCFCNDEEKQRNNLNEAFLKLSDDKNPQLFVQKMVDSGNEMKIVIVDYDSDLQKKLKNKEEKKEKEGNEDLQGDGIVYNYVGSVEDINRLLTTNFDEEYFNIIAQGFLKENVSSASKKFRIIYIPTLIKTSIPTNFFGVFTKLEDIGNKSFKEFVFLIQNYLTIIFSSIINHIVDEKNIKIRQESIKSAIAAVMSRNMSHNLGSHVFFYTRQELLRIYDAQKGNNSLDEKSRMIKGMAWFMHYVQERQDFIANINSGDDFLFGPMNFKQDVIDEITPDGVDYRHKSLPQTRNFLLENIVRSEKIVRKTYKDEDKDNYDGTDIKNASEEIKDIDISVIYKNEALEEQTWITTWNGKKNIEFFYDIDMAVGGGQQSRHAFLIILENIIRNSAKHGGKFLVNKFNKLKITIEINEKSVPHLTQTGKYPVPGYEIRVFDNIENANFYINEQSKIFNIENLTDKLHNIKMLSDNSIDINRESKGLKEILIAVMWMKGLSLNDIETHCKDEDVLSVIPCGKNIGYRFYLPKFQNNLKLEVSQIESFLTNNESSAFGSVYSVDDIVLREAVHNKTIEAFCIDVLTKRKVNIDDFTEEVRTEKIVNELKNELQSRIPRIVFNVPDGKNIWQYLFENRYGGYDSHIIWFDRTFGDTIEELKNNVFFTGTKEVKSPEEEKLVLLKKVQFEIAKRNATGLKIYFNNHLSQSVTNMEGTRSQFCVDFFKDDFSQDKIIYETISGANQIFNLMQKFVIEYKTDKTNNTKSQELINLYWNVLKSYSTKIVIVDERLSFADSNKDFIDENVKNLVNGELTVEDFVRIYFNQDLFRNMPITEKINDILHNDPPVGYIDKIKKVISFMNNDVNDFKKREDVHIFFKLSPNNDFAIKDNEFNENVRVIQSNIKELFYNQQNTFLFNLDNEQNLIQSSGIVKFEKEFDVDFFSIHIGLLDKIKGNDLVHNILDVLTKNKLNPQFISVHSGRGGLNSEDEKVTFVPFSVLQRCLEDSKYMLTEFLNNYKFLPIQKDYL